MAKPENIFLVGPMGAGKTTIGRQLARALSLSFHDSDREIEQLTGADIPLIFDLEGEKGFRKREQLALDKLTKLQGIVLATGGGAILDPENRKRLVSRGKVVYLHTSVDQQLRRAGKDKNRPLLQTDDPRKRLEELMMIREPLYRETADLVVVTNGCTVKQVMKEIQGQFLK